MSKNKVGPRDSLELYTEDVEASPDQDSPATNAPAGQEDDREGTQDVRLGTPEDGGSTEEEDDNQRSYTIDDVVDMAGYGKFQKFLTFLAGLGWFADAFEVIILSLIGDLVACSWTDMKRWQNALMTSVVFVGMTFGAPVFGIFADKWGRRTALGVSMFFLFVFGAASAFAPNYITMTVLRGLMGFSLGGIAQGVTLCCEYYPAKMRGRAGFYLSYYWSIGAIGVVGLAWVVMMSSGEWKWFVFGASIPALIVFLTMPWYPESVRYYIVSGQTDKAIKTLERLTHMNNVEMPKGKLKTHDAVIQEERGKMIDLLKPKMIRVTLLFWYIWFSIACAYYGIALITPEIIKNSSLLDASKEYENKTVSESFNAPMPCKKYTHEEFGNLMWTTAAEFPGIFIFTFTVEYCNRKTFLGTSCIIEGLLILLLMLKIQPVIATFVILFVCRGLIAAIFQLLFIMTTEAFPTTLRASAMGTGSACARIGGLLIPYLAQVVMLAKPIPSIFVLAGMTVLAGVAALCLPADTRGKAMADVVQETVKLKERRESLLEPIEKVAPLTEFFPDKDVVEETLELKERRGSLLEPIEKVAPLKEFFPEEQDEQEKKTTQ